MASGYLELGFSTQEKADLFEQKLDEVFELYESVKDIVEKDEPSAYKWGELIDVCVWIVLKVGELYSIT